MIYKCQGFQIIVQKLQKLAPRKIPKDIEPQACLDVWRNCSDTRVQKLLIKINEYQSAYTAVNCHRLASGNIQEILRINRYYQDYFKISNRSYRWQCAVIYLLDELVNPKVNVRITKFIQNSIDLEQAEKLFPAFARSSTLPELVWEIFQTQSKLLELIACQLRDLLELKLAYRIHLDDAIDKQLKRKIYIFLYTRSLCSKLVWTQLLRFRLEHRIIEIDVSL